MIAYLSLGFFSLAFCLVAKRLASTILTAPISFIGFGTLIATLGLVPEEGTEQLLHLVAEVALILLLFLDAAKIDPAALRRRHVWPLRMLLLGLPLGFAFGLLFAWMLLPGWPLATVAVVAAILLPTDAALGQPVIANPDIPDRGRRALTVESGPESEGQLVSWAAFFLLGALLVPEAIAHLSWPVFLLIITSLFIVRPLAIWLSLLGSDASPATRLFFGWFGPRGLATALFALLVVRQLDPGIAEPIMHIAINAVWISAILHGVSAAPGARWYALRMQRENLLHPDDATESSMQSN